ncbi:MAG: hypothetical protein AAGD06_29610 [Acidobacteriota bacterium]
MAKAGSGPVSAIATQSRVGPFAARISRGSRGSFTTSFDRREFSVSSARIDDEIGPILRKAFHDSSSKRNKETSSFIQDQEVKGAFRGSETRAGVAAFFEEDVRRRGEKIQKELERMLRLGLLGDNEAVGETLDLNFRRIFEEQTQQVNSDLTSFSGHLAGLSLGNTPKMLLEAHCTELRLSAREYIRKRRPPLPVIDLESSQEELLLALAEKWREVPAEQRTSFCLAVTHDQILGKVTHQGAPGWSVDASPGDIVELTEKQLLRIRSEKRPITTFLVRPEGVRYCEELMRRRGSGFERQAEYSRNQLLFVSFRQRHRNAFERWALAEEELWHWSRKRSPSTVGHLLREAIQQFAYDLVKGFGLEDRVSVEVSKDQRNARAVLDHVCQMDIVLRQRGDCLGRKTEKALYEHWVAVSNLVQRLVHRANIDGKPVTWEDARRAVFLVSVAMIEIDHAVSQQLGS